MVRSQCLCCAAQAEAAALEACLRRINSVEDNGEFEDPITGEVIVDPVVASDGCTYDRCCKARPAQSR